MVKKNPVWSSAGVTHPGLVRKINEDAYLSLPEMGMWAVADGMGGHAAGDIASQTVVDALARVAADETLTTLEKRVTAIENALLAANGALIDLAIAKYQPLIGSTVVLLNSIGELAVCLWAGDSRIYRYRLAGGLAADKKGTKKAALEQLTQDHAVVEELMQVGLLERTEADIHPHANRITRAIGAAGTLFVDMEIYALQKGDRFVLCSDGLYKELSENDIVSVLAAHENDAASAQALLDKTVERGARDNTSIIVATYT